MSDNTYRSNTVPGFDSVAIKHNESEAMKRLVF